MKIIDFATPLSQKIKVRNCGYIDGDSTAHTAKTQAVSESAEIIKKMPAVDRKKVAEIKDMLHKGTYKVAAEKAASQMLTEALLWDS